MRGGGRFIFLFQFFGAAGLAVALLFAMLAIADTPAQALPSFARQTGQPCGTCHTDFPALTPYGRRFKLLGYTTGGGKFRTTPWLGAEDFRAAADKLRGFVKATDSGGETDKGWVPPISMMGVGGLCASASTSHIGSFSQVTYNAPGAGGFSDPFGHTWTWDNTDVRYADET